MKRILFASVVLVPAAAMGQPANDVASPAATQPAPTPASIGAVRTGAAVDTNTVLSRTLSARAKDCINVKTRLNAQGNNSADDSAAFVSAINQVNTLRSAARTSICAFLPAIISFQPTHCRASPLAGWSSACRISRLSRCCLPIRVTCLAGVKPGNTVHPICRATCLYRHRRNGLVQVR